MCHTPTAKEYKKRIVKLFESDAIMEMAAETEKNREENTWFKRAEKLVEKIRSLV